MQRQFRKTESGIFLFNIIPSYRPGMSRVFDYGRFEAAASPSLPQRIKQNRYFIDMEDICGECLEALDLLYVFATDGDSTYAKINWKSPGSFQLSQSGTVTFTTNEGFQGNGTNGYLSTGYTPSTNGVNYTTGDASMFCGIVNDVAESRIDVGAQGPGVGSSCLIFSSRNAVTNQHHCRINNPGDEQRGSSVSSDGFYHLRRVGTGNSQSALFKNGAQVGADLVNAANGLPIVAVHLLANNNNGNATSFSTHKMSMFGLGASLSGQESALYDAWNDYFTGL